MTVTGLVKLAYILLGIYLMMACLDSVASFIFALILSGIVSVGLDLFLAKYTK